MEPLFPGATRTAQYLLPAVLAAYTHFSVFLYFSHYLLPGGSGSVFFVNSRYLSLIPKVYEPMLHFGANPLCHSRNKHLVLLEFTPGEELAFLCNSHDSDGLKSMFSGHPVCGRPNTLGCPLDGHIVHLKK